MVKTGKKSGMEEEDGGGQRRLTPLGTSSLGKRPKLFSRRSCSLLAKASPALIDESITRSLYYFLILKFTRRARAESGTTKKLSTDESSVKSFARGTSFHSSLHT